MKKFILCFLCAIAGQACTAETTTGSYTFSASPVVWKLREGSADNWAQLISPAGTDQTTKIIGVPFKWDPGFRLGVGYDANKWNTHFYYTNYQTTGRSNASGRVFSAFLGNFYSGNTNGASFGPFYTDASMRWRFVYNVFDLNAGHKFAYDNIVKLTPTVGLKFAFIDQNMFSNWSNPTSNATPPVVYNFTHATEDLKNSFWGLGPSIGLNTTWPLYNSHHNRFSLIGDVSGALMWSKWRFKDQYKTNAGTVININNSNINGAATMVGGIFGVEWDSTISQVDVALRLSYEAQVWFNQMQFYSYNMGRLNNLMSLQGGTFDIRVSV